MQFLPSSSERLFTSIEGPKDELIAPDDRDNDDIETVYKWIGLGIVIASAIASNLGVNVQKLSHLNEARLQTSNIRTYFTRPLWIIGMFLIILGAIGDVGALGFAPQALVASVGGGCTVLVNVFFAHLWLGQVRYDLTHFTEPIDAICVAFDAF